MSATKATWKRVREEAASMGADAEIGEDTGDVYVYAPRGHFWKDSGASVIVEPYETRMCGEGRGQSWRGEAYASVLERMGYGLKEVGEDAEGWWTEPD